MNSNITDPIRSRIVNKLIYLSMIYHYLENSNNHYTIM